MIKALTVVVAASTILLSASAFAGHHHYGVPQGFDNNLNTVAAVQKNAYDDQYVVLRGRLINYLGHDHYEFADETGVIEVELDDDHNWSYLSKGELIEITAKVDRDFFSTELEVKRAVSLERGPVAYPQVQPALPAPGPVGAPAPVKQ